MLIFHSLIFSSSGTDLSVPVATREAMTVVVKMLAYVPLGYLLFLLVLGTYRYFKEKKNDDQIDAAQMKKLQDEILTSDEEGK